LSTLNVLDALILVILGWNIIRGFNKGFVEELLSLLGIGASILIAYFLTPKVAPLIQEDPEPTTLAITGFVIYVISFLIFKYIAIVMERKAAKSPLGILNNILGFLFGFVRGLIIASIVVFFVAVVSPDGYLIKRSSLGGITVPVIDKAIELLGGKVENKWRKNWETAKVYLEANFEELKGLLLPGGEEEKEVKGPSEPYKR